MTSGFRSFEWNDQILRTLHTAVDKHELVYEKGGSLSTGSTYCLDRFWNWFRNRSRNNLSKIIEIFTSSITNDYIEFIKKNKSSYEGAKLLENMRDEFKGFFHRVGRAVDAKQYGVCKQKIDTVVNKLHAESLQLICDQKHLINDNFARNVLVKGHGRLIYSDKNRYEGPLKKGIPHGQGKLIFAIGDVYEGQFDNGELQGQGRLACANGDVYEGQFDKGELNGRARLTFTNGDGFEAWFTKGYCQTDSSYLSDLHFLRLLIGTAESGSPLEYSLGIMSDYLIKNGYSVLGDALKSAKDLHQMNNGENSDLAKAIYRRLKKDRHPQLSPYGHKNHSMGLNLVPDPQLDCVFLEVFNSAPFDISYHPTRDSKYQTRMRLKAPLSSLTPEKIAKFLNSISFKNEQEAYEEIFGIPGIKRVKERSPIWQTEQKSENCSLEWIFAYLKNKMGESEYNKMRLQLFKDCVARIEAAPKNKNNQEMQDILVTLKRKIRKRRKKINDRKKVASQMRLIRDC